MRLSMRSQTSKIETGFAFTRVIKVEMKKTKYDTNPLDPDVERKAEESWGQDTSTQQVRGATRPVGNAATPNENARQNVYSEAPTRRYDNPPVGTSYPSVFVPPTYAPPAQYQHQQQGAYSDVRIPTSHRSIPGIGVSEKWALMMNYAPYVGLVVSLIELFLVPRRELRVRFHASQALALHIAFLVIQTIFGGIKSLTGNDIGAALFGAASTIFLVISMIRVWKGEPHSIAPLAEPAKWFNDHIEPRNQS
jgi:uncharacterized membrane protein